MYPVTPYENAHCVSQADPLNADGEKEGGDASSSHPYRTRNRLRHPALFKKGDEKREKRGSPASKVQCTLYYLKGLGQRDFSLVGKVLATCHASDL